MESLTKQVRLLQLCVLVLIIAVITLGVLFFLETRSNNNFKELTAERINIVEPGGQLKMVISSKHSQHPGRINNRNVPERERDAGIIFFNESGDECGGLIYNGNRQAAGMTYSVDQFRNDQVMQLQYSQDRQQGQLSRSYGLKLWDRDDRYPLAWLMHTIDSLKRLNDTALLNAGLRKIKNAGGLGTERLFVGRTAQGQTGLFLKDAYGRPRLRIYIGANGKPVIETLDDKGKARQVID